MRKSPSGLAPFPPARLSRCLRRAACCERSSRFAQRSLESLFAELGDLTLNHLFISACWRPGLAAEGSRAPLGPCRSRCLQQQQPRGRPAASGGAPGPLPRARCRSLLLHPPTKSTAALGRPLLPPSLLSFPSPPRKTQRVPSAWRPGASGGAVPSPAARSATLRGCLTSAEGPGGGGGISCAGGQPARFPLPVPPPRPCRRLPASSRLPAPGSAPHSDV